MRHPFLGLSDARHRAILWPLAGATLVVYGLMAWVDAQYHTPAAPLGIVSLQLTNLPMRARWIIDQWSQTPGMTTFVAFGLGLDFLFFPLYSTLFALVSVRIAEKLGTTSRGAFVIGVGVAWLQWVGAALDAGEDVIHLLMLVRRLPEESVRIAFGLALGKFAALGGFFAFALAGTLAARLTTPRDGRTTP